MEHRKTFGTWLVIGLMIGMMMAALGGCSVSMKADAFYPKDSDPREAMPWYGGADGDSNRNGIDYHKFNRLGE